MSRSFIGPSSWNKEDSPLWNILHIADPGLFELAGTLWKWCWCHYKTTVRLSVARHNTLTSEKRKFERQVTLTHSFLLWQNTRFTENRLIRLCIICAVKEIPVHGVTLSKVLCAYHTQKGFANPFFWRVWSCVEAQWKFKLLTPGVLHLVLLSTQPVSVTHF